MELLNPFLRETILNRYAALVPSGDRGRNGRGNSPRAVGPGPGRDVRRHRRAGVPTELFELSDGKRQGDSEVHAVTALQDPSRGGPDSERAPWRRDAKQLALYGAGAALSRAITGDRGRARNSIGRSGEGKAGRSQAGCKAAGGELDGCDAGVVKLGQALSYLPIFTVTFSRPSSTGCHNA